MFLSALATQIHFASATTYSYYLQGPYFMDGSIGNLPGGENDTVICSLLWANNTRTSTTLSTAGPLSVIINSDISLYQVTWNSSSALNYTSLIDLQQPAASQIIGIYIPDPLLPEFQYTFTVTDFYGMTNPYLRMTVNNASGLNSAMAEQISLNSSSSPTFLMTQYYTYTLTFLCDQGTYSQTFTAETTLSNSLIVLAGAFPIANTTVPTADATRLNATLIGITYVDPSNTTTLGNITISHQSGSTTISDYTTIAISNSTTLLWNAATGGVNYNVNVTTIIAGSTYIWVLTVPSSATANPWLGAWDWLGSSTPTMPYVTTGWPLGMTTYQIAELVGGVIIAFFLTIGSYRSSGATCIVAWIMSGFLMAFGWWGNGVVGGVSAIPMFALSGFLAILIHISEAKETAREI